MNNTARNLMIVMAICLFVTMIAAGVSIATLKTQVVQLEEFRTKVDSVYIPNINRELISNRNLDFWHDRSLTAIDSITHDKQKREVIKILQQQNQPK